MENVYLFKNAIKGLTKDTQRPYHIVEIHCPITLDNFSYYIQDGVFIDTDNLKFKDKVEANIRIMKRGRDNVPVLVALKKAQ